MKGHVLEHSTGTLFTHDFHNNNGSVISTYSNILHLTFSVDRQDYHFGNSLLSKENIV